MLCSQLPVVKLLLKQGADRAVSDLSNHTALELQPTPEMRECFLAIPPLSAHSDDSFEMVDSPTLRASAIPTFQLPTASLAPKAYSEPSQTILPVESDTTGSTLLNRTFSFGTDIRRSKLTAWLASYRLERAESALMAAGVDSIEDLLRHEDSQRLAALGIRQIGLRARLMAALEAELGIYPPHTTKIKGERGPFPALECCRQPVYVPGVAVFGSLRDWLSELELDKYLAAFEAAGYDHLESVLGLTKTRYPVTEDVLMEIGVEEELGRLRLLRRIHEDGVRVEFFRPRESQEEEDVLDSSEKTLACQLCKVM